MDVLQWSAKDINVCLFLVHHILEVLHKSRDIAAKVSTISICIMDRIKHRSVCPKLRITASCE